MISVAERGLIQKPGIRQFIKFCIVGATSFTIDFGVSYLLHYYAKFPVYTAKTLSFCVAVTNGFFWNQRWTFRAVGHRKHHEQYAMFLGVNVVGLLLNGGIFMCVIKLTTGEWSPHEAPKKWFLLATLAATAVVVFWNFFANKHWTFKPPPEE